MLKTYAFLVYVHVCYSVQRSDVTVSPFGRLLGELIVALLKRDNQAKIIIKIDIFIAAFHEPSTLDIKSIKCQHGSGLELRKFFLNFVLRICQLTEK